jgi:hypothetical protein
MIQKKLSEVDMRLTCVKAGIEMGKANGDQAFCAHDFGGAKNQSHGELLGLAGFAGKPVAFFLLKGDMAHEPSLSCTIRPRAT